VDAVDTCVDPLPAGYFGGNDGDPDRESLYLIFGPLNAVLYAVVGFMVWRYTAARSHKGHISN
jgi:hypothetical protein